MPSWVGSPSTSSPGAARRWPEHGQPRGQGPRKLPLDAGRGDLKDPADAIPKGTLLAIATTFVSYVIFLVVTGCVSLRYAPGSLLAQLGDNFTTTQADLNTTGSYYYEDCIDADGLVNCTYGNISPQVSIPLYPQGLTSLSPDDGGDLRLKSNFPCAT